MSNDDERHGRTNSIDKFRRTDILCGYDDVQIFLMWLRLWIQRLEIAQKFESRKTVKTISYDRAKCVLLMFLLNAQFFEHIQHLIPNINIGFFIIFSDLTIFIILVVESICRTKYVIGARDILATLTVRISHLMDLCAWDWELFHSFSVRWHPLRFWH